MVMFTCTKAGFVGGDAEGEELQRKSQMGNQQISRRKPVLNHPQNSSGIAERRERRDLFVGELP
jgi:hypothetical protein